MFLNHTKESIPNTIINIKFIFHNDKVSGNRNLIPKRVGKKNILIKSTCKTHLVKTKL